MAGSNSTCYLNLILGVPSKNQPGKIHLLEVFLVCGSSMLVLTKSERKPRRYAILRPEALKNKLILIMQFI